jgi:hypothetical protein
VLAIVAVAQLMVVLDASIVTIALAHGPSGQAAGVVHGFAVAFGFGAAFLAVGAILSAAFVRVRKDEAAALVPVPA